VRFVAHIFERSVENYHDNKKKMILQHISQFSIMERARNSAHRQGNERLGLKRGSEGGAEQNLVRLKKFHGTDLNIA